jgi:hypothetical protein
MLYPGAEGSTPVPAEVRSTALASDCDQELPVSAFTSLGGWATGPVGALCLQVSTGKSNQGDLES